MAGLEELLSNKLFLQYLAGAGADISSGGGVENINKITQQNIQSQNFMNLLKRLLGPDDTKGTFDKSGMSLKIPATSSMFSSILGGGEGGPFKVDESLAPSVTTQPRNQSQSQLNNLTFGGGAGAANPFVISQPDMNVSAADLAGLTTADIGAALGGAQAQQHLKSQSYRDMVDAIYKGTQIASAGTDEAYKKVLTRKAEQDIKNEEAIYPVEGTNMMLNAKDYIAYQKLTQEDKPAAVKNYEYAKKQGFVGSFTDFQDMAKTTHKKDYDEAVAGGYKGSFNTWMTEMAKAGAINLGTELEKHEAMAGLKGMDYFSDPKWTADLDKQVNAFNKDQAWLIEEAERPIAESKVKVKFIEDKITAGGGTVQDVKFAEDGKTMVWSVKWPNGKVKEIRYAVRP